MLLASDRVILGANFLRNHDVLFDRQHDKIAFVKANCTKDYVNSLSTFLKNTSEDFIRIDDEADIDQLEEQMKKPSSK